MCIHVSGWRWSHSWLPRKVLGSLSRSSSCDQLMSICSTHHWRMAHCRSSLGRIDGKNGWISAGSFPVLEGGLPISTSSARTWLPRCWGGRLTCNTQFVSRTNAEYYQDAQCAHTTLVHLTKAWVVLFFVPICTTQGLPSTEQTRWFSLLNKYLRTKVAHFVFVFYQLNLCG